MVKQSKWKFLLMFLLLSPIYLRGLFELIFERMWIPYLFQVIAVLIFIILLVYSSTIKKDRSIKPIIISTSAFLLLAVTGSIFTLAKTGLFIEIALFSSTIVFLYMIFIYFNLADIKDSKYFSLLIHVIFVIGIILLSAGIFEFIFNLGKSRAIYYFTSLADSQYINSRVLVLSYIPINLYDMFSYQIFIFPGNSHNYFYDGGRAIIRPASLTGSMLHFPILMSIIGAIILRFEKKLPLKILGFLFMLIPFLVFSRSGILISSIACGAYALRWIITERNNIWKNLKQAILPVSILITAVVIISVIFSPLRNYLIAAFGKIFTFHDISNNGRFIIWGKVLDLYSKTNIVIGEMTGYYSNIVKNILGYSKLLDRGSGIGVTESGFLEILTSYGLFGVIAYYSAFTLSFIMIYFHKKEYFLAFVLLGVMIQTFFYQSIEVLPIVFTLSLLPMLARNAPVFDEKVPILSKTGNP